MWKNRNRMFELKGTAKKCDFTNSIPPEKKKSRLIHVKMSRILIIL